MQKRLHPLGNSLALIIDKPTRRLLGISRRSELKVYSDGRRLIVEPIRKTTEPPPLTASELDALPVFNRLVEKFGMSQAQFAQLHHERTRMFAYKGGLATGVDHASDDDRATFRRFEACLAALQRGASWNDALTIALHAEPKPGDPTAGTPKPEPTPEPTPEPKPEAMVDPSIYAEVDDEHPADGVEVSWG